MKPEGIEILHLDIFYVSVRIFRNGRTQITDGAHRRGTAGGIPLPEDWDVWEIYEVMKMPVIRLTYAEKQPPGIKLLCCCCFRGSISVYLFSDNGRQVSIINL